MEITAKLVKDLRDKTGAGMMECKKALTEADGDQEKATRILRERGIAKATSKAGRVAKEGAIVSYIHPGDKLGVLLENQLRDRFCRAVPAISKIGEEHRTANRRCKPPWLFARGCRRGHAR